MIQFSIIPLRPSSSSPCNIRVPVYIRASNVTITRRRRRRSIKEVVKTSKKKKEENDEWSFVIAPVVVLSSSPPEQVNGSGKVGT